MIRTQFSLFFRRLWCWYAHLIFFIEFYLKGDSVRGHVPEIYEFFTSKLEKILSLAQTNKIDNRNFEELLNAFTSFLNKIPLNEKQVKLYNDSIPH
jgi:hypothetical protein